MAAVMVDWHKAPKWAQHTSTFARDERCKEVVAIFGSNYTEVYYLTEKVFRERPDTVDCDINQCGENDQWVGVIVEDV
jgi:hypothetical protein